MSKIENYKREKNDHDYMIESAMKAMNDGKYSDRSRDKHGLSIGDKWHDKGESMGYLTGYSGFYGSSGCTYQCTARLAHYLRRVINQKMKELVTEAILLSEKDVEKARNLAEDEARSVLLETKR